ncbi:MAG TPA: adenylyl-sulfate kinase, partial [Caldilineaceae bacterium]|nr:adenylyl-sulfate kinase [Caldilineaceae bacterium]
MGADQSLPGRLAQEGKAPGFAIWLTGLPASGKTTLARALQEQLARQSIDTVILDSDELRRILTPQPTYRADERDWFYAVLAGLAGWLTGSGINVLIAATANRRTYRQAARAAIKRFAEIYVTCALETCQQRDRKGIYAAANAGQADHVPGLGSAYEPPLQP